MRVETLFTKEPETIKWIDNFQLNPIQPFGISELTLACIQSMQQLT